MSIFLPSTTVTIQRGEGTDDFGDPVDNTTVVASGVPAFVTEGSSVTNLTLNRQISYHPSEQRGGVVETFTIRLRPDADVKEQDRLVDERTTAVYQVIYVINPHPLVGVADVRVIANRVAANSQAVNA